MDERFFCNVATLTATAVSRVTGRQTAEEMSYHRDAVSLSPAKINRFRRTKSENGHSVPNRRQICSQNLSSRQISRAKIQKWSAPVSFFPSSLVLGLVKGHSVTKIGCSHSKSMIGTTFEMTKTIKKIDQTRNKFSRSSPRKADSASRRAVSKLEIT